MNNPLNLEGKVAVISGGSSGIGFGTAQLLAEYGAKVVLLGSNQAKGDKASQEIRDLGYEAIFKQCDVTNNENCKRVIESIEAELGRIDVLFNNAGATVRKTV